MRRRAFAELRSEFPDHAYTHQAALLVASAEVVTAPDAAAEKLRFTMEQSDDPELAMVARLRLARVLAYRDQYQEALALLDVPEPGQFAGRIAEIRGDIHVALGETDAARTAYLEAMVASGAELLDRSFLQMKLADLPGAAPEPAARRPSGAAAAPDAGRRRPKRRAKRRRAPSSRERAREHAAAHRGTRALAVLAVALGACAGAQGHERAAGRAHRVRRDARRRARSGAARSAARRSGLRLGLRPATDGARIYAGAYDGQVAAFDAETRRQGLVGQDGACR